MTRRLVQQVSTDPNHWHNEGSVILEVTSSPLSELWEWFELTVQKLSGEMGLYHLLVSRGEYVLQSCLYVMIQL